MADTSWGKQLGAKNDTEEILIMVLGVFGAFWVLKNLPLIWARIVAWMVSHHILVGGAAQPMVALPGCGGAGLDQTRLFIVIGLVLCSAAPGVVMSAVKRRIRRENQA